MNQKELEALAAQVGALLVANGQKLVTAESCTGGWVAQCLTAIAGSSTWFDRAFVSYSNEAKREMLGVKTKTLAVEGAVSEAVVREMVAGAVTFRQGEMLAAGRITPVPSVFRMGDRWTRQGGSDVSVPAAGH